MTVNRKVGLSILVAVLAVGLAVAAPQGKSKKPTGQTTGDKIREVLPEAERVFTTEEVRLVKTYFRDNRNGLPPGLAKREELPPGLQRQLQKNGKLPPGLQKKIQPLSTEIERRLRGLPTGYRRVVIAGNVILLNEKTAVVYDIIRNVIE